MEVAASETCVSGKDVRMSRGIAVAAPPEASAAIRVGSPMVTENSFVNDPEICSPVSGSVSTTVVVTERSMSTPLKFSGGVMESPET